MCPQCGRRINAPQAPSSTGIPGAPLPGARTDGKAIASMVLGILSLLLCLNILTGIPAIILGHISRSNIRKSMGRLKGDGIALTGLILGYLNILFIPFILIIAAIAIHSLIRARTSANEASAVSMVRTLISAEAQYQTVYANTGYAPDIATLGPGPGGTCGSEADSTAEHACLITGLICTGDQWCTKTGYRFVIQADEQRPHQQYVISALPMVPDRTGRRGFCSTVDGVIRFEAIANRNTPYTAEECAALTPIE
ncbi:MAG TPA: DUF4190 domain-containing protein [Terriglobales bacterium]|nr:DUF4190 domain-containing protein [Terriglobales bacterium]